jgi:hypothetical protein
LKELSSGTNQSIELSLLHSFVPEQISLKQLSSTCSKTGGSGTNELKQLNFFLNKTTAERIQLCSGTTN